MPAMIRYLDHWATAALEERGDSYSLFTIAKSSQCPRSPTATTLVSHMLCVNTQGKVDSCVKAYIRAVLNHIPALTAHRPEVLKIGQWNTGTRSQNGKKVAWFNESRFLVNHTYVIFDSQ
ncbi:hypothetical protein TNCV_61921 [Trichonephila clavipes]|nr:hypothetical protein TNCV_61921 [Trichonephila clavipes]